MLGFKSDLRGTYRDQGFSWPEGAFSQASGLRSVDLKSPSGFVNCFLALCDFRLSTVEDGRRLHKSPKDPPKSFFAPDSFWSNRDHLRHTHAVGSC